MADAATRPAALDDADDLFELATQLATSAVPERAAFDSSLEQILAADDQLLLVHPGAQRLSGYLYGMVHPRSTPTDRSAGWRN